VIAIKCESCGGFGRSLILMHVGTHIQGTKAVPCFVCNGTGTEKPPQPTDKDARIAIEGETDDE
jgi:hypothetical protein